MKPIPGLSYLAQSPAYYEMLENNRRAKITKGLLGTGAKTRRMITENRISKNILIFNQPTAICDFTNMEVSTDYHTQVSVSKFRMASPIEDNSLLSLTTGGGLPNNQQMSLMGPSYQSGSIGLERSM